MSRGGVQGRKGFAYKDFLESPEVDQAGGISTFSYS